MGHGLRTRSSVRLTFAYVWNRSWYTGVTAWVYMGTNWKSCPVTLRDLADDRPASLLRCPQS